MRLMNIRISDDHLARWQAEAKRLGITVTTLVKSAVDERIAADASDPTVTHVAGVGGEQVSVIHGSGIVGVMTVLGPSGAVWAGHPTAARALAAALIHQAADAEALSISQQVPCPGGQKGCASEP